MTYKKSRKNILGESPEIGELPHPLTLLNVKGEVCSYVARYSRLDRSKRL